LPNKIESKLRGAHLLKIATQINRGRGVIFILTTKKGKKRNARIYKETKGRA
jgi:hypothetical protein